MKREIIKYSLVSQLICALIVNATILLFISSFCGASADRDVIVVFRFDDYSELSSTEFEMNLIDSFQRRNISITFAVVPYISSTALVPYINENNTHLNSASTSNTLSARQTRRRNAPQYFGRWVYR